MKLKVCGMKYESNIMELSKLNPSFMGFIFHKASKRFIEESIPDLPHSITKIGVFVDADISYILDTILVNKLNGVQLHGNETVDFINKLKAKCQNQKLSLKYIKVFAVDDSFNFNQTKPFTSVCDYFLFDTKGPLPGGNGFAFDWKKLNEYTCDVPYLLSGGIGIHNKNDIKSFINSKAARHCYAIDVNSKFEIAPGNKNITSVKNFKQFCDEL